MKPTTPLLLLVTTPATAKPISMSAAAEWTMVGMVRSCDVEDTRCSWTFSVATAPGNASATPCSLVVTGSPASQEDGGPETCGNYTVTSGWSGQFGPDYAKGLIAYASYTDKQVSSGEAVSPDLSFPVNKLP